MQQLLPKFTADEKESYFTLNCSFGGLFSVCYIFPSLLHSVVFHVGKYIFLTSLVSSFAFLLFRVTLSGRKNWMLWQVYSSCLTASIQHLSTYFNYVSHDRFLWHRFPFISRSVHSVNIGSSFYRRIEHSNWIISFRTSVTAALLRTATKGIYCIKRT